MQQQGATTGEAAPDGAGELPAPDQASESMSATAPPPASVADAPARPPVGWSPAPLAPSATDALPHATAASPAAGPSPAPATETLPLVIAAPPAPEQAAERAHAGLSPAAAADDTAAYAAPPPPAGTAPESLQSAPQLTQELAPAEPQAHDPESAGAPEGARSRPHKLSMFKGMTKAAAAAAAKLTDGERGGKARGAAASKGAGADPKGSKPDQAPGPPDGRDSAATSEVNSSLAGTTKPTEGPGGPGEGGPEAEESDAVKAARSWAAAMGAGSLIHDLFRGQLQSSIECQTCKRRSTMCAPAVSCSVLLQECSHVGGVLPMSGHRCESSQSRLPDHSSSGCSEDIEIAETNLRRQSI